MTSELIELFSEGNIDLEQLHAWLRDDSLDRWVEALDWRVFWKEERLPDETRTDRQFALDSALNTLLDAHQVASPSDQLRDLVSFFRKKGANPYKSSLGDLCDEEFVCTVLDNCAFASLYDREVFMEMEARLTKAGSNVATWSLEGRTILTCALWGRAPVEVVRRLLELGVSPFDARSDMGICKEGRLLLANQFNVVGEVADAIFDAMVEKMVDRELGPYEDLVPSRIDGFEAAWARKEQRRMQEKLAQAEGKRAADSEARLSRIKPL